MKIDQKALTSAVTQDAAAAVLLPLERTERKYQKHETSSFKLKTDPVDATSTMYEVTIPIVNGNESIRDMIDWIRSMKKVRNGLILRLSTPSRRLS